jgi:hypothetical protein
LEKHFLAGPYHPALRQLVDSEIAFGMAEHLLQENSGGSQVIFICHPKEVSNLRGQRNGNILKLKKKFQLEEIATHICEDIAKGTLVLQNQKGRFSICRKDLYHCDRKHYNPSRPPSSKGREEYIIPPFIKGDAGGL